MTNYILKPCPFCGSNKVIILHNKITIPFCLTETPWQEILRKNYEEEVKKYFDEYTKGLK